MTAERLRIIHYPAPALRRVARPVERVDDRIRAVARAMIDLMHEARGVGLAAPQVGLSWRMFVANPDGAADEDVVFINPVLSEPSREMGDREEGCLSLPGVTGVIRRPLAIMVEALDLEGASFRLAGDDLAARVWQHETDHLDGTLIIDRMTQLDRMANRQALRVLEEAAPPDTPEPRRAPRAARPRKR